MNKIKGKIVAAAMLGLPVVALAEGEQSTTMDTTAGSNMIKSCTDGLVSLLETVTPYVTTLILAGLAIWAAMVVIRIVKRAFSRAG